MNDSWLFKRLGKDIGPWTAKDEMEMRCILDYIKLYFITHIRFWRLYLLSVVTLFVGIVVSLMFAWFLAAWGVSDIIAWITAFILGRAIGSSPLIYPNDIVVTEYLGTNKKDFKGYLLFIINHFVSYCLYLILYYIIVTNMN